MPDAAYCTFDDPVERDFARVDPNGFLNQFGDKQVILDEIQYCPEILSYLKMRIDHDGIPGKWILTGSQQFHMMHHVRESLAGRIGILELPTFSLQEVLKPDTRLKDIVWNGLYPSVHLDPARRDVWLRSYLQTYLERDVRSLENIRNLQAFENFIGLLSAFHGQEFHASRIARECGVSQPTIKAWKQVMTAGYLGLELKPFFTNYGKRLVKAPKYFLTDSALVTHLVRLPTPESSLHSSSGGAIFEGLMITEAWKAFLAKGKLPALYYWRSNDGLEIDLIIEARQLHLVEIKLSATPSTHHAQPIMRMQKLAGKNKFGQCLLVCRCTEKRKMPGGILALPWRDFPEWLTQAV